MSHAPARALVALLLAVASPALAGPRPARMVAHALLAGGRLLSGGPLVSNQAGRELRGPGVAPLGLHVPGRSSLGLVPEIPADAAAVLVEALVDAAGPATVDVLVDGAVAVADLEVPPGRGAVLRAELPEAPAAGPRRIDLRLARGAAVEVQALAVRVAPGPRRPPRPPREARAGEIPIHRYFPLAVGLNWHYRDFVQGEDFTLRVVGHEWFGGGRVARIRRLDKENEYDLLGFQGAVKLYSRSDDYSGTYDFSDDPPPFSLGATVRLGDRFEAIPRRATNPVTGGYMHWIVEYKRFQDVSVPAGSFPDSLRLLVRTVDTRSGVEIARMNMYLAKDVGIVRRDGRVVTDTFKQLLTGR